MTLLSRETTKQHLQNLEEVLRQLLKHGVHVNQFKCHFLQTSVVFLGHRIETEGIHPTTEKLRAISEASPPKERARIAILPGSHILLCQVYSECGHNLSRKGAPWKWTKDCQHSFDLAKEKLASTKELTHFNPNPPTHLAGDASAYGIGAVILHETPDSSERPIAFASCSLSGSECNYAQVEMEALSLIFGVKRFHTYLYGRLFTLITDHQPLTAILGPRKGIPPLAAARLQRWPWTLSAYQYSIEFRPTGKHGVAQLNWDTWRRGHRQAIGIRLGMPTLN